MTLYMAAVRCLNFKEKKKKTPAGPGLHLDHHGSSTALLCFVTFCFPAKLQPNHLDELPSGGALQQQGGFLSDLYLLIHSCSASQHTLAPLVMSQTGLTYLCWVFCCCCCFIRSLSQSLELSLNKLNKHFTPVCSCLFYRPRFIQWDTVKVM